MKRMGDYSTLAVRPQRESQLAAELKVALEQTPAHSTPDAGSLPDFDEADGQAETAGNIFDSRTACHERRKGLGFVGRVHGEAVEVLREAGLDGRFSAVLEHEAHDFVIAGEDLFVREREHGAAATLPGFDLELALGGGSDDEVLKQAAGCDAGLQFGVCC